MAVNPSPFGPKPQFLLTNGLPAVGNQLFFYVAGTVNTKQNTYTDSTGGSANPNPIILNSLGEPPNEIWFTAGQLYKVVYAPSTDTDPPTSPIWTIDNLRGINDSSATLDQWQPSGFTPTYIGATQFSVPGDQTNTLTIGRRIKATVTAGTVYGRITASAYAALTTVTVQMDGSQALDSGLSDISYSLLTSDVLSLPARVATASGNFTYTANVGITNYVIGDTYLINFTTSISSGASLNLDGRGARALVNRAGVSCSAGDVSGWMTCLYNGTSMTALEAPCFQSGMIKDFGGTSAPTGYLLCDGSNVSRGTHSGLFAAIGITWGAGDGVTTFGLPDFRRRVGMGSGGAGTGTIGNAVGNTGGEESHVQLLAELAAHAHSYTFADNQTIVGGATPGAQPNAGTTGSAGSSTAFNVIQPSAIVLKVIKT